MHGLCIALMRAYPGTTWQYWAEQPHNIVAEAIRQVERDSREGAGD